MEATEHAQKSVIYADENRLKIRSEKLHNQLEEHTHNNAFLQREEENVGIHILEKEDIEKLNSAINKKSEKYSPYNAIRFTNQDIDDQAVGDAINVAEKAVNNLDKKVEESKGTRIDLGDVEVSFDI